MILRPHERGAAEGAENDVLSSASFYEKAFVVKANVVALAGLRPALARTILLSALR